MVRARGPILARFPPSWATGVRRRILRRSNIIHQSGEFLQLLHRIHIVQRNDTPISDYLIGG